MPVAVLSVPVRVLQILAFKCPTAQICVLRPLKVKSKKTIKMNLYQSEYLISVTFKYSRSSRTTELKIMKLDINQFSGILPQDHPVHSQKLAAKCIRNKFGSNPGQDTTIIYYFLRYFKRI
jgi:hypothetical protein